MKRLFNKGDKKIYHSVVGEEDVASFEGEVVHHVCSTFALAREIEWATRQYVLEMKEEHEEGVGTMIRIDHKGPAFVGETLEISSIVDSFENNHLICSYEVRVRDQVIASGETGQKILDKTRFEEIFDAGNRK